MRNNLFIIAKNGWSYIAYASLAFVIFSLLDLDFLAFLAFVAIGAFVYLFRNPERVMPFYQANSLVAPSDGVITAIEQLEDEVFSYRVDIESSYFNVGILRVPMHAKLSSIQIVRGSRTAKDSKLFTLLNEYAELVFTDDADNSVKIVHRLKQGFAPIDIELVKSQELMQAARYGLMINGITSVYLPSNIRLNVNVGQEVLSSETLIGYFS